MRSSLASLKPKDRASRTVTVVVETPGRTRSKYTFDEALGLFRLYKMLPLGAAFPFDFGFIPGTRAEDGDPVDVLVVGDEPTFTGCVIPVRVLGVLEAEQTEKRATLRNDRVIAMPETPKIRPTARSLNDLPEKTLAQIEHFFVAYNQAEGRKFVVLRRSGPAVAHRRIDEAIRAYRKPNARRGGHDGVVHH